MYRLIIIISLVLGIIGWVSLKINTMGNQINDLTHKLEICSEKNKNNRLTISLKDGVIEDLANQIEDNNNIISAKHKQFVKLQKELKHWRALPPKIKYRDKIVEKIIIKTKDTNDNVSGAVYNKCESALELNKQLKDIKYEDL